MKTGSGEDVMYSIVKTVEPFEGAQYCLTMDFGLRNDVIRIQGFFYGSRHNGDARRRRDGDGGKRRSS